MGHLAWVEVDGAETLDARGVDEVSPLRQRVHLGEGGRVHALVVGGRYGTDSDFDTGQDAADDGRFPHPRVAR